MDEKRKKDIQRSRRQCSILGFNDIPDQREEETTTLKEILLLGDPLLEYQGIEFELPIQLITVVKLRCNFDEAPREIVVYLDRLFVGELEEVASGGSEFIVDVGVAEKPVYGLVFDGPGLGEPLPILQKLIVRSVAQFDLLIE